MALNETITELYLEMYDFLLDYAKSKLGNYSLAEEAVQEVFKIACQKPKALCNSKSPKGWLVKTLKYVMSNMKRTQESSNRVFSEYILSQAWNYAFTEDSVAVEVLYENIAETEDMKLIMELIDGHSHLEMAEKRGISVSTCRKRVQRARENLKRKIKL